MNKYIITFITIISFISSLQSSFAQKLAVGEQTINNKTFTIGKSTNNLRLIIDNKYKPSIPDNKEIIDGLYSYVVNPYATNRNDWKQLVVNALPKEKLSILKQNKEKLSIHFFVKPETGDIYYMSYSLPHNTILTVQELSNIDKLLMDDFKFKYVSKRNRHLQLSWTMENLNIDFGKL